MSARAIYRYAMFRVDPAWRRLPDEERALHKKEFADLVGQRTPVAVHAYSTVGLKADTDLCLWLVANDTEDLQAFQQGLNATHLGRWLISSASYVALTKPSRYLKGHSHDGQEVKRTPGPLGRTYLFVYPMDKKRAWYRLPFEERRRMMAEHFKIGHRYPGVTIHTGYSFGIDDQEFVVAFEGDSITEFSELVEELRGSDASSYTERDVPIFSCVRMPIEEILDQLDGS